MKTNPPLLSGDLGSVEGSLNRTVAQAIHGGAIRLTGIADSPGREARLLLAHALGVGQNDLIRNPERLIDPTGFEHILARRVRHEPLALIIGRREFWSMMFQVSPATLVPRPDSETLVEAAVAAFAGRGPPRAILDLGTGTGCLLLALLAEFPSAFGIGVDLAEDAAVLAKANAVQLGLINRSAFVVSDWTSPLRGQFDLIISNPPYIRGSDIGSLMPEVAFHEPRLALDGGPDGYDAYRDIVPKLRDYLEPLGRAVLEVGHGQAAYVARLAEEAGFKVSHHLDLAQISRALVLARPNC